MKKSKSVGINEFEIYLYECERSKATAEKYLRDVKAYLAYLGNGKPTRQSVLSYKAEIGERYATASANSMIASVNQYFKFCGRSELCVKQFRVQKKAFCSAEKELSEAEYRRLVKTAEKKSNERLSLLLQTICASGIRVSELSYITVEAVRKGCATVVCKGKTRTVFIVAALQRKLLKYIARRKIVSGAVFVTRSGKPVNRCNVWKEMKGLCAAAEVSPQKVFPHNLRHLFARIFYEIDKDISRLADVLGHSSINTTRVYIITTGAEHRKKMENMRLII